MAYTLTCIDCGGEHEVRRSDARYCPSCRLLRALVYCSRKWRRAKTCRACSAPFRPHHARDFSLCGDCETRTGGAARATAGTCSLCKKPGRLVVGMPVCLACVKGDASQSVVIAALRRGQGLRKKENAAALARLEAGEPRLRKHDNATAAR